MARLREKYKSEIAPALAKEFDIKNPMAIPKVEKVIVNIKTWMDGHRPPDRVLPSML